MNRMHTQIKRPAQLINNQESKLHHLLFAKIPIVYSLLGLIAVSLFLILLFHTKTKEYKFIDSEKLEIPEYTINRLHSYKFIQPLLSAKPKYEYGGYREIKKTISDLIRTYNDQGIISNASVYFRDFDKSNWTVVNPLETYSIGSIIKIPILLATLKSEDNNPGYLNKKIVNNVNFQFKISKMQSVISKQIEFGKSYTSYELLKYMIEYSDNKATQLLWMYLDKNAFLKMFDDYNLPRPDLKLPDYGLSVEDCSIFLESLFNGAFLTPQQSEFAINLLLNSSFTDGIVKGIPNSQSLIAHKFGEAGTVKNRELHETAIFYLKDKPYLLTIMTRGKDNVEVSKLALVIQGISHQVYDCINSNSN